jgi:hypothetical protein
MNVEHTEKRVTNFFFWVLYQDLSADSEALDKVCFYTYEWEYSQGKVL